eukprot:TRINITY_DN891_c1_g2_i1.p1 TRINITY_DN891_c1_g2~~TRINITY_DN891_c1_g2_i1.p1  ORF type:complete len:2016 (+),score=696.18 TRINITY_DN891_c1_g2_i1:73-6120(+)
MSHTGTTWQPEQAPDAPFSLPRPTTSGAAFPLLVPRPLTQTSGRTARAAARRGNTAPCPQRRAPPSTPACAAPAAPRRNRLSRTMIHHAANDRALGGLVLAKCPALAAATAPSPAAPAPAMRATTCAARDALLSREHRRTVDTLATLRSRLRAAAPPASPARSPSRSSTRSPAPQRRDSPAQGARDGLSEAAPPPAVLDLAHCDLCDADSPVLRNLIRGAPAAVRTLDLTGNARLGDATAAVISDALATHQYISEIRLEGTGMSEKVKGELVALARGRGERRARKEQRRAQREGRRQWRAAECARFAEVQALLNDEWDARKEVAGAMRALRRAARSELRVLKAADDLRLARAAVLRQRRIDRQAMRDAEAEARRSVVVAEVAARGGLISEPWEQGCRRCLAGAALAERAALKREEVADWLAVRTTEKARAARQAAQRAELEAQESAGRLRYLEAEERELAVLAGEGRRHREACLELQAERVERERAEAWAQKQEQMRQEKERELRAAREARDRARHEATMRQQRERFHTTERAARVLLVRDEDWRRQGLAELQRIAKGVARARQQLGDTERARAAAYAAPPRLSIQVDSTLRWHYLGDFRRPAPISNGVELLASLETPAGTTWEEVDEHILAGREALRAALTAARAELQEHAYEVAPVLFPSLDAGGPIRRRDAGRKAALSKGKAAGRGGAKAAGAPEPWEAELRALLARGREAQPTLWFDESDCDFNQAPPLSQCFGEKLTVHGGVVSVSVSARGAVGGEAACSAESEPKPSEDAVSVAWADAAWTVTQSSGPELRVEVPEGATLEQVSDCLDRIRYQNNSTDPMLHAERLVTVAAELRYVTLGPGALDRLGRVDSLAPFGALTTSRTEAVVPLVVVPPLLSAPAATRAIVYEEDTPTDRCVLLPEVAVTPVPLLAVVSEGMLIPRPGGVMGEERPTYDGGFVRVQFKEGYTPDDQIVLAKRFDDDIGVMGDLREGHGRMLCLGPRGIGEVFGEVVDGELLTHRECQERGDLMGVPHSSRSSKGLGGFVVRFCNPDLCRAYLVQKFLRRLRFANLSQKPGNNIRVVEIGLAEATGQESIVEVSIELIEQDDPTEMHIPCKRVVYRPQGSPAVPLELRTHLRPAGCPLFPKAALRDPDTDYFRGGDLTVTVSSLSRGDLYFLRAGGQLQLRGEREVTWGGKVFGVLEEGLPRQPEVACEEIEPTPSAKPRDLGARQDAQDWDMPRMGSFCPSTVDGGAGSEPVVFRVVFTVDGNACLSAAQELLRSIYYCNSQFSPPDTVRQVGLTVRFGPNADQCAAEDVDPRDYLTLQEKTELRCAMPLFEVPKAHCRLQYKEGSGAQRLAPFEVPTDQMSAVDSYGGGYILVETVSGATEDDVLGLRTSVDVITQVRPGAVPSIPDFSRADDPPVQVEEKAWDKVRSTTEALGRLRGLSFVRQRSSVQPDAEGTPPAAEHDKGRGAPGTPPAGEHLQPPRLAAVVLMGRPGSASSRASGPPTAGGSTPPPRKTAEVLDRVRNLAQSTADEHIAKKAGLAERLQETAGQAQHRAELGIEGGGGAAGTVSDVLADKQRHIGSMHSLGTALYIKLDQKGVQRRDVVSLLRAITYANKSSDPDVLEKVLRVSIKDGGQCATQAIVAVEVQSVDDITDIRLTDTKLRYCNNALRIFSLGCLPLAPVHRACLEDPDTEWFDGGGFAVEVTGGGQRGDNIGFMTLAQQESSRADGEAFAARMRQQRQDRADGVGSSPSLSPQAAPEGPPGTDIWDVPVFEGALELVDGKRVVVQSTRMEVGTLEYYKQGPATNARVRFNSFQPPAIDIRLASYVMNCFCYTNVAEKMTPGQRTYVLKIADGSNPVDGKIKISLDVVRPLVMVAPGQLKRSCQQGTSQELNPFERPQVFIGGEGKGAPEMVRKGFTEVALAGGCAEGDCFGFAPGTSIVQKEGGIFFGVDFLGKVTVAPQRIRLEHSWTSKLSAKSLAAYIGAILVKTHRHAPARQILADLTCSDGKNDANYIRVTIDVK